MPFTRRQLIVGFLLGAALALPGPSLAEPSLFVGSIRVGFSRWPHVAPPDEGYPIGGSSSYPSLELPPWGGVAYVSGASPAAFSLPAGQFQLATSFLTIHPNATGWTTFSTEFSASNDTGSFRALAGPGTASSTPIWALRNEFKVSFLGGRPNRFGGVMRLLPGRLQIRSSYVGYLSRSTQLPLSPVGGFFGETATSPGFPFSFTVWGFPWTTGTVKVTFPGMPWPPATHTAQGSDMRTPNGHLGNINLVTPFLVTRSLDGGSPWPHGFGIARAQLEFVPEPAATTMLLAGLAMLGLMRWIYWRRQG